jgi:hypothetical protein
MTKAAFESALEAFLSRKPFRVFAIELRSGSQIEIDDPRSIARRRGLVVHIGQDLRASYFDHESVVQLIDGPASDVPAIVERR